MSTPWVGSAHCLTGAHCRACRSDAQWRQGLLDRGKVTTRDFACPYGRRPPVRPGTLLTRWLQRMGFRERVGCGCESWALKMNAHPPAWSWQHRRDIAEHMVDEAHRVLPRLRGISGVLRARLLYAAAIVLIWLAVTVRVAR